ncbi:hypothetical protein [Pelagerythrobacter rhizovicinus]|uniref:Uncharacterized protein n=1 Tax=Pelagerythrobacter rhizovicinus TaxID=2268576 RepID=A0A4Q2KLK5_9SPHN|nr:hypothetical protein [Pelagerythrobacter rhizovicinus]RXZ66194.1 hypothetical protein ETX26_05650 [Pelagerythrobacter rhizovicinus]
MRVAKAKEGGEAMPHMPLGCSPWATPPSESPEDEGGLRYKLIFKHPTTSENLVSLDFDGSGEEAAVVFHRIIAGYLSGELWHGGTLVKILKPDTALFSEKEGRL